MRIPTSTPTHLFAVRGRWKIVLGRRLWGFLYKIRKSLIIKHQALIFQKNNSLIHNSFRTSKFFHHSCWYFSTARSSHPEVFCKKGVLSNFIKFTGKHLCQGLFLNKVAGLRPQTCNFIKKKTLTQVFSCEFWKISKNTLFTEQLWATASDCSNL